MPSTMFYPFEVKLDTEGSWLVQFPDIPEACAVVDAEREVRREAVAALEAAFAKYFAARRPVPVPSTPHGGQDTIAVSPGIALKLMQHNESLTQDSR